MQRKCKCSDGWSVRRMGEGQGHHRLVVLVAVGLSCHMSNNNIANPLHIPSSSLRPPTSRVYWSVDYRAQGQQGQHKDPAESESYMLPPMKTFSNVQILFYTISYLGVSTFFCTFDPFYPNILERTSWNITVRDNYISYTTYYFIFSFHS